MNGLQTMLLRKCPGLAVSLTRVHAPILPSRVTTGKNNIPRSCPGHPQDLRISWHCRRGLDFSREGQLLTLFSWRDESLWGIITAAAGGGTKQTRPAGNRAERMAEREPPTQGWRSLGSGVERSDGSQKGLPGTSHSFFIQSPTQHILLEHLLCAGTVLGTGDTTEHERGKSLPGGACLLLGWAGGGGEEQIHIIRW